MRPWHQAQNLTHAEGSALFPECVNISDEGMKAQRGKVPEQNPQTSDFSAHFMEQIRLWLPDCPKVSVMSMQMAQPGWAPAGTVLTHHWDPPSGHNLWPKSGQRGVLRKMGWMALQLGAGIPNLPPQDQVGRRRASAGRSQ